VGGLAMTIPLTFFSIGSHTGSYRMGSIWTHSWGSFTNYSNDRCGFANSPYDCNLNNRLFLYKTNILNISKPSNGLRYRRLVGMAGYLVFALPVEQFDLDAQFADFINIQSRGTPRISK